MLFQDRWKACAAVLLSAGLLMTCFSGCESASHTSASNDSDDRDSVQAGIVTPGTDFSADSHPGQTVIPGRHSGKHEDTTETKDPETDDPATDDPDNPPEEDPPVEDPPVEDPPTVDPVVYGELPEGPRVEDSYFDDAVFIGDSVTLMLQYYTMKQRADDPDFLGKATFLTAGSFSYRHAVTAVTESSIHPVYEGTKMLVEDAIAKIGAKKIYIMLGMNDIANRNYTATLENLETLVSRILEKNPDVEFYFESVTPRMANSEHSYLNNEIIRGFNELLAQYCVDNSHYFVNIYAGICDESGALPAAYCSDPVSEGGNGMGIHFTYAGCAVWTDYLYTHTA
ncbi:MAG: hypothetical protein IIZ49_06300 [Oscillospiraceae bacterium]|nr:hypothetical protein [Oscillospiraceae bacterium]